MKVLNGTPAGHHQQRVGLAFGEFRRDSLGRFWIAFDLRRDVSAVLDLAIETLRELVGTTEVVGLLRPVDEHHIVEPIDQTVGPALTPLGNDVLGGA